MTTVPPNTVSPESSVPLIDLGPFRTGNKQEQDVVAAAVHRAFVDVGFVYLTNHGVSQELLDEAFVWSKKFFDLPLATKMTAPHPPGPSIHRGYSFPGLEKVSQVLHGQKESQDVSQLRQIMDFKESFEVGSEKNVDQPNVILNDANLPGFHAFMQKLYWQCHETEKTILECMAVGLGLDRGFFHRYHSGNNNQLRLLHYPPIKAMEVESGAKARIPAHTGKFLSFNAKADFGSFTMLFQDDCGGLEIESPSMKGEFQPAPYIRGAVAVNVGDLLMMWSNGNGLESSANPDTLKSTLHRVMLPPLRDRYVGEERLTRERYSIPYFCSPDPQTLVECIPECASANNPAKYPPVVQKEYRLRRQIVQY